MTTRRPVPRQLSVEEEINPFTHKLHLTWLDKLQVAVMSVTIAPIRLIMVIVTMLTCYVFCAIALKTVPEEDRNKPLTGWRKALKRPITFMARCSFFCFGFHWIRVVGRSATKSEAPILCCAPHTSFSDILIAFVLDGGLPSGVAKIEIRSTPVAGMLARMTEPVYVNREDPDSRQNTIKEIKRRALGDWPQVLIFPEGTVSNGTCLMQFKQGGFMPGLPVQPVCLRYTNSLDTYSWTWDGYPAHVLMWLTLCQFHNGCEVIYLPVYYPSEEEKADSRLFAKNVRTAMAKYLNVPCTDVTFEECKLKFRAHELYPPIANGLVELQAFQRNIGFSTSQTKEFLATNSSLQDVPRSMSEDEFIKKLDVPSSENAQQLFRLFDREKSGKIDFVDYLIGLSVICNVESPEVTVQLIFKLLGAESSDGLSLEQLSHYLRDVFGIDEDVICQLWNDQDFSPNSVVTFDGFKQLALKTHGNFERLFKNQTEKNNSNSENKKTY